MGIGFQVKSTPWKRRMWAKPTVSGLAKEMRRLFTEILGDEGLTARLNVLERIDGITVSWHPAEEGLCINLLPDGELEASAKTNTVGPGYHRFLVESMDRIAERLSIHWLWKSGDEDGDETGYAVTRDYAALKDEMLKWLRAVSRHVLESGGAENTLICMPIGPYPLSGSKIATPMGLFDRKWFGSFVDDDALLGSEGPKFFAWWEPGRDAGFWANLAKVVAWTEVPWVAPRDDAESEVMRSVVEFDRRARVMDPAFSLPKETVEEIEGLLQDGCMVDTPKLDGIGHRKLLTSFSLFGHWSVKLGGHFRSNVENDGGNIQIEDGAKAVYVSAMTVNGKDDMPMAAEGLVYSEGEIPDMEWREGKIIATAKWEEDESSDCKHLFAKIAVDGDLLLLTVTDTIKASSAWAESVVRSATYAGNEVD